MARLTPEADLQARVIGYAKAHGWLIHHDRPAMSKQGRWATHVEGHAGFPDLVLARDGAVIFAELKSEKGRVSPAQMLWLASLCPTPVFLWRPQHWEDGTIQRLLA